MSGDRYDSLEKQIDALTCEGCRLGLGTEIVADYPSHHFPSGYRKGWKICTAQGKAIMELVRQAAPPPQTELVEGLKKLSAKLRELGHWYGENNCQPIQSIADTIAERTQVSDAIDALLSTAAEGGKP